MQNQKRICLHPERTRRQEAAKKRQAEHDQRTVSEQLQLHQKRNGLLQSLGLPFMGSKEVTRLNVLCAVGKGNQTFESLKPKKEEKN